MCAKYQDSSNTPGQTSEASSFEDLEQSYPNEDENQTPISLEENRDFFQKHGMFFCGVCNNIMSPTTTKGQVLEYSCRRCGIKPINFKGRTGTKCMVNSRSLQLNSKRAETDNKQIFDPAMSRMIVECPQCEYHQAVYMVVPEQGERRIILKLICARGAEEGTIKCGKCWDLQQNVEIQENLFYGVLRMKEFTEQD